MSTFSPRDLPHFRPELRTSYGFTDKHTGIHSVNCRNRKGKGDRRFTLLISYVFPGLGSTRGFFGVEGGMITVRVLLSLVLRIVAASDF